MTLRPHISTFVSRVAISLMLLAVSCMELSAQRVWQLEKDSIPVFRGFAVSFDLAGLAQMQFGDYGQYEGALRLNIHDQYFPILELGYGKANHEEDAVTGIKYKTQAPYFRVGADVNIMNNKHTGNRVFVGFRYGFSKYNVDLYHAPFQDPVWGWTTNYEVSGVGCNQHWGELLFGLDAKVYGPLHLGWSGRYRFRLGHNDGGLGNTWYVPGYGLQDTSVIGYSFYVSFDI